MLYHSSWAHFRISGSRRNQAGRGHRPGSRTWRFGRKPYLEPLEDRTLLTTFTVVNTNDSGPGSLRQAILDANSQAGDDMINCSVTGTINLTGALPDLNSNIQIQGPGAASLTVRRDTGGNYRIFTVVGGATIVLDGLTISNGAAVDSNGDAIDGVTFGGGIANLGSTLTVSNSTFTGNLGGGIYNTTGSLTVIHSTFASNTGATLSGLGVGNTPYSTRVGSGIYNANGGLATVSGSSSFSDNTGSGIFNYYVSSMGLPITTVSVSDSTFSRNQAGAGGGIFTYGGTAQVNNSTFSRNSASGLQYSTGGGIDCFPGGTLTVSNSTFSENQAGYNSDGVYVSGSGGWGGGIGVSYYAVATVSNCTFSGNRAFKYAGGIFAIYSRLTVTDSSLTGNSATTYQAGGIWAGGSAAVFILSNTIVAGNTAPENPDVFESPNLTDADGDGIDDAVDTQPTTFSNDFSDGTTTGSIVSRGTKVLTIVDALDPAKGVLLTVKSTFGLTPATVSLCNGASTITLDTVGDQVDATCGSVILDVRTGPVEATFLATSGQQATVSLPTSTSLTFEPQTGTFAAPATNQTAIVVLVNGMQMPVGPGATVLPVQIDIKPGSYPNTINLGSGGTVPVAILSTATFNATMVNPLTVTLAGAGVNLRGNGTAQASQQDVNGDGRLDLVVHVATEALQLTAGDVQAVLTGQTYGGLRIQGRDSVRIVNGLHAPASGPGSAGAILTQAEAEAMAGHALARWASVLGLPHLSSIIVVVEDLPGNLLGTAVGNVITLDANAAGWGWFIDRTPADDSEFPADQNLLAWGRVDLLSVVCHEMGHVLGLEHSDDAGVMDESLPVGVRRVPIPDIVATASTAPGSSVSGTTDRVLALLLTATGTFDVAPIVADSGSGGQTKYSLVAQDVLATSQAGANSVEIPPPALPRSPSIVTLDRLFADLLSGGLTDALAADTLLEARE